MVSRLRIIVGWAPKDGQPRARTVDWTLILPPIVLRAPNARDMYWGLFQSPFMSRSC